MGKRGPQPKSVIDINWRPELAYAVGLLVTDGNLSSDRRHISFVSKDMEQIDNYMKCLGIKSKIGKTFSGYKNKFAYRVQIGNVLFYNFLCSIGLMPAKSKIIGKIKVPDLYFWDYIRGSLDGDGTFHSYWDKRWRSSHMFYLIFVSASEKHILWTRREIAKRLKINGHITKDGRKLTYQLKYAKKDTIAIIKKIYYSPDVVCLSRKRKKIERALVVESKQQELYAQVAELVYA